MTAEYDASMLSIYRLKVDDRHLGKFRSSGIIVATGTGSSGWLYSARQVNAKQVHQLKMLLGCKEALDQDKDVDLADYNIAKTIND